MLATLSDGEDTIIAALRTCWPDAPHQRCQEHFLANLAEPVLDVDTQLRKQMREDLGGLPAVPTQPQSSVIVVSDEQPTNTPFCPTPQISETES